MGKQQASETGTFQESPSGGMGERRKIAKRMKKTKGHIWAPTHLVPQSLRVAESTLAVANKKSEHIIRYYVTLGWLQKEKQQPISGEALGHACQRTCGHSIPGSVQDEVEWGLELSGLV